jgi:hypothetical protein
MSDIQIDIPDITVIVDKGDEYLSQIIQPATIVTSATGSLLRYADIATSSSYALTASYALNVDDSAAFPFTGSAKISGSLQVLAGTISGSFVGDGSGLTGLVTDLRISGSTGSDVVSLINDDLTFAGTNGVTTAVTNNTVTIGIPEGTVSSSAQATSWSVASASYVQFTTVDGLTAFSASVDTRLLAQENFSASLDATFVTKQELAPTASALQNTIDGLSTAFTTYTSSADSRIDSLEVFTSSIDTTIKTELDAQGVISSSTQIDVTQTINYATLATTGSNVFIGNQIISGSLITTANEMAFAGNMEISGSLIVTDTITGTLIGTASSALTASFIDGGYY